MKKVLLTIGIPTWNRADYLKKCLESIIPQIVADDNFDKVNILISDNDSTDHTFEVATGYMQEYSFIKYSKNDENIGFKNNFLKIIEKATGNFIWFMGDDDTIVEEALQRVVALLKENQSIPVFIGDSYNLDKGTKEYLKIKTDLKLEFEELITQHMDNIGKISNVIMNRNHLLPLLKKVKNEEIERIWPHIFLILLLMVEKKSECYLCASPITTHKNHHTILWTGIDFLKLVVDSRYKLACLLEKYIGKEKTKSIKKKVFNVKTFKGIWLISAFLDSDRDIRKEVFRILSAMTMQDKFKLMILCLPLFIPSGLRRFFIIKTGYLLKGKKKTQLMMDSFQKIKIAEERLLNDKTVRRARGF